MRCIFRGAGSLARAALAALLFGACIGNAAAEGPPAGPALRLDDAAHILDVEDMALVWIDARGSAGLEQVLKSPSLLQKARPDEIYSLGDRGALWLRYRLQRAPDARHRWLMAFPMPVLDRVTVYQQDSTGHWSGQTAGDTLAVSAWPEPGRYPHFRIDLPPAQVREVYVRIQHLTGANFPVQLLTESAYDQRIQIEYAGLGLTFGALLLLIAACVAQGIVYRDGVYGWYALYALVTALGVTSYTGVAGHLLWPGFGALGDSPQGCLALLAGAAALLFVRNLIGISARHPILDQLVLWSGLLGIALAAAFPALPKAGGLTMVAVYVASATLANLWIAFAAWRRDDAVGGWVLLAYLPLTLAVGMALLRLFGWLPVTFGTQYAIVVAMALEVPLLLVALNIRSRERHGAQIRELALSTQDALTGLLAPHLFHDRLRQVVARYKRHKEGSAVVFIDLVNHQRIKDNYGAAVAEQSLLRSVIKLRRLLRDVDTVSRVGEARFGLILEGVTSRIAVTDRAARLIAAGLMPLKGLKPEVTLQFHIAAALLGEKVADAPELERALDALLGGMSARTRRPIRFLEPETTEPAVLVSDSSLIEGDSQPGLPAGPRPVALSRIASQP